MFGSINTRMWHACQKGQEFYCNASKVIECLQNCSTTLVSLYSSTTALQHWIDYVIKEIRLAFNVQVYTQE